MSWDIRLADALVITAVAVIIAVAVVLAPTIIIPLLVTALIQAITMMFLVTRNVFAFVPVVLHEVDPLSAGFVFVAVLRPLLGVSRRHAQVARRTIHPHPFDDNRPALDDLRLRIAADVQPSIEAGLADAHGNTHIGRECGSGARC